MNKQKKELCLTDLIDLNFLQELQDGFAKTMDVASLVVDDKGPVTKPSNFNDFCTKYIRSTSDGFKKCNECDIKWGNIAAKKGEPVIYSCHAGLTDFAVPITIEGKYIGSIYGGQVLTEKPNEEKASKIAKELGIDEKSYLEDLSKIKIVPMENIKSMAKLLYTIANAISEIGYKNLKLIEKRENDALYSKAMEAIRNTLDIDELKQIIVNIVGEALHADRCFIVEYNQEKDKFLKLNEQYLSPTGSEKYTGPNINDDFPNFFNILKKGQPVIINRTNFLENEKDPIFNVEKESIKKYNISSIFVSPLFYQDKLLGVLSTHYEDETRKISEDEISLVTMIANHVAIALHQANLYKLTQMQAEREKVNRTIIEIVRSTLDKNTIKHLFVKTIGNYLKADRVFVSEYDNKTENFNPVEENCEYLSGPEQKSCINQDTLSPEIKKYLKNFLKNKELLIVNTNEYLKKLNLGPETTHFIQSLQTKSSYNFSIYYQEQLLGFFYIGFTKEQRELDKDDIELIRNICKQAATALYQADLYAQAQESATEKSNFIANISHEIKTPLNIIIGFSDLLSDSQIDREKQIKYLNNINQSGKYLLSLTNDILNMSKIDSGKLELNYEKVESDTLIMEVVNSVKLMANNKSIKLTTNIIKADISVDKKMLTQVLYNLLSNAIKYTQEGGETMINSELSDNNLLISVEDNGIGIDEEDQHKIFEAFRQVDSTYVKRQEGTGLGLAITKKLIELHNGSIHLESVRGKGSKFWFILPLAKEENLLQEAALTN